MKSGLRWLWLSVLVICLDQLTKSLATQYLVLHQPLPVFPGLNLTLMHNTGAAFSFLSQASGWQRWFFILLAVGVSVVLMIWLARLPRHKVWLPAALAFIIGGALGNVWDRIVQGYVVDFIDVYLKSAHWPAFNVADSAITIGAVMLIVDAIWLNTEKSLT